MGEQAARVAEQIEFFEGCVGSQDTRIDPSMVTLGDGMKLHFIQPGKPTQNGFVESFDGRFREYGLDLNWFAILQVARLIIERWRQHLDLVRPHRSLGRMPPAMFARESA